MARQDPTAMTERAEGGFKEKYITQTNSVQTPLIEHLSAGEQLHYLFYHHSKGFRIFEPDGEERTPDHDSGAWGKRFLLITDERILYVVGRESGDDVQAFGYDELTEVDANHGWTSGRLNFTTTDGREYKFADSGSLAQHIEDAGEYVRARIENAASETASGRRQDSAPKTATESAEAADTTPATDEGPADGGRASGSVDVSSGKATPSDDVSRRTTVTDPDELEANAKGNVDGTELTSTGGKMFKVGYFHRSVTDYLVGDETIHYTLRNFVDGVEKNGTAYEPSDNRRAIACVTDRRLLFVIGGTDDDGGDTTMAVALDRVLRVGEDDGTLVVVAISPEGETDEYRFPVKNAGELPAAVEYIDDRSDESVLDGHVEDVDRAVAAAEEALEANAYEEALGHLEEAFEAYEQYHSIAGAITSGSSQGEYGIPTPTVSRDELEAFVDRIRSAKWTDAYEEHRGVAEEHRAEAERSDDVEEMIEAYERAIDAYTEAQTVANEADVGDPAEIQAAIAECYDAIYTGHLDRAQDAREDAEREREAGDIDAAIAAYERAVAAYTEAQEIATEHDVGDPDAVESELSSVRKRRDDLEISSLGRRVSDIDVPEQGEGAGDRRGEFDDVIGRLEALLEQLDETEVDRTEDIDLIRMEARRKLVAARIRRGRATVRDATEQFDAERYLDARETFNEVGRELKSLRENAAAEALGDHADELDRLIELCDRNADVARKRSIGLTDDEGLRRLDAGSDADEDAAESPEQLQYDEGSTAESGANVIGTDTGEDIGAHGTELSYGDIEKGEQIGSGGNADVYRATADIDGVERTIALKEPRMQGTIEKSVIEQFVSEAETWSKLDDHEHIVSVVGFGSAPLPWIALEYMDEGDLSDHDDLRFAEKLAVATRITDAVWYAHQHGIAHLDLKPANILFASTESGRSLTPKVADWGLARMLLDHSKSVDALSPRYSAPEQFDSETYGTPDNQTDLYQLGVILYELFAGEHPFEGSPSQVMHSIMHETPEPPSAHESAVSSELDEALLTALAKEKADRQEAVIYLRDALQSIADSTNER